MRSFRRWAAAFDVPGGDLAELPVSELSLILWITFESKFLKAATLQGYLYGIQDWSLRETGQDPLANAKLLKKLMRALTKAGTPKRRRRSVTLNVLRRVHCFFDLRTHDHRCLWSMFTLSVATMLRIGEAVPKAKHAPFTIRRKDWMVVGPAARSLFIRRSKRDQEGKGAMIKCPSVVGDCVDAVKAVDDYIRQSTVVLPPTGPLFVMADGTPLTRPVVIKALRQATARAGLVSDEFHGISFRKGGALSMALGGVNDRIIQAMGRWSSDSYKRYVQLTDVEIDRATAMAASCSGLSATEWAQPFLPKSMYGP